MPSILGTRPTVLEPTAVAGPYRAGWAAGPELAVGPQITAGPDRAGGLGNRAVESEKSGRNAQPGRTGSLSCTYCFTITPAITVAGTPTKEYPPSGSPTPQRDKTSVPAISMRLCWFLL